MHSPRWFEPIIAHWFRLLIKQVPQLIFLNTLFPNTSNNLVLLLQTQSIEKYSSSHVNYDSDTNQERNGYENNKCQTQKLHTGLKSLMNKPAPELSRLRLRGTVNPRMELAKVLLSPLKPLLGTF